MAFAVRLGAAEQTLIDQLKASGAAAAAERLSLSGLPTRRVESYHYTDLKTLLREVPALVGDAPATGQGTFGVEGAYRFSVSNGRVAASTGLPAGVHARIAHGSALTERDDVLVRLNGALARQTLALDITGAVDGVLHISRDVSGEAAHVNDSVQIFAADGARATVIESFATSDAAHVANHASHVRLGKGAELTHILLDLSNAKATNFATAEYHLAAEAKLRTLTIHVGSALSRMNLFASFAGEGAHVDTTGLNLVDEGQHSDITLELSHSVPHCTSKPLYKQVARGRSRAAFQGKIIVARDAQKTDAKLMMQGLMLSDTAEILSKPELEIFADDVVCGHGSTVGALDVDSLFYLMSRGIPRAEAESMLVRGFLEEVLDPITDEALHAALETVVDRWLVGKG